MGQGLNERHCGCYLGTMLVPSPQGQCTCLLPNIGADCSMGGDDVCQASSRCVAFSSTMDEILTQGTFWQLRSTPVLGACLSLQAGQRTALRLLRFELVQAQSCASSIPKNSRTAQRCSAPNPQRGLATRRCGPKPDANGWMKRVRVFACVQKFTLNPPPTNRRGRGQCRSIHGGGKLTQAGGSNLMSSIAHLWNRPSRTTARLRGLTSQVGLSLLVGGG
jgi:hypothetical protein